MAERKGLKGEVHLFSRLYMLLEKWFPRRISPMDWRERLAYFYSNNNAYHVMTSSPGKERHPQVGVLLSMIQENGHYAEVGCGGGAVARLVGCTAFVHGFDVSPIAIEKARAAISCEHVIFDCVPGNKLPLESSTLDGCYSFEVLEHIWDPVSVLREMVRTIKPGGWLLISMPNHFSLDLHLTKKPLVRGVEFALALYRCWVGKISSEFYWNLEPDIDGDVYPDCDMVTTLNPMKIQSLFEQLGCDVVFVDSTYMCANREGSYVTLQFQRNTARPIVKYLGDHWLILVTKKSL